MHETPHKSHTRDAALTEGPIAVTLARLTGFMVLGFAATISFNLVDTWFVARLGTEELAAIGFTFPVVMLIGAIAIGLGIGTAALVSRAIGEGDGYRVKRLSTDSLVLSLVIVLAFILTGLATLDPVFRLLGADEVTLPLIREYMLIWYPGMLFLVIPMVGNNAIRATGDMKWPAAIMMSSVLLNVILDPLLIFGIGPFPRLELAGAALATVISRACTLALSLFVLHARHRMLTATPPKLNEVWRSWKALLFIGIPAAAGNLIRPLGIGVITALVARFGTEAVAAYGVSTRIDAFAFIVLMALATVLGPFVGQNIGAGKLDRVKTGIRYAQFFSIGWGGLAAVVLFLLARPIAGLFSGETAVVNYTVLYLHIVPVSYGLLGVFALCNAALNVLNRPWSAATLAVLQMFILAVPAAILGSHLLGIGGIFAAIALAAITAGFTGTFWLRYVIRKLQQQPG